MTELKTVQTKVRAITVRCGADGCTAKSDAVAATSGESGGDEIVAPQGWTFGERDPQWTRDVAFGKCPEHSKK